MHAHLPVQRPPPTDEPASYLALGVPQQLLVAATVLDDGQHLVAGQQLVEGDGQGPFHQRTLVPPDVLEAVDHQGVHRGERVPILADHLNGAGLQLEEAHLNGQPGIRARLDQALRAGERRLRQPRGRAGRRQHTPLPAHLVLLRRGAVGVEEVALEDEGVGQPTGCGQRRDAFDD